MRAPQFACPAQAATSFALSSAKWLCLLHDKMPALREYMLPRHTRPLTAIGFMIARCGAAFVFLPFVHGAAFLKGEGGQCKRSWRLLSPEPITWHWSAMVSDLNQSSMQTVEKWRWTCVTPHDQAHYCILTACCPLSLAAQSAVIPIFERHRFCLTRRLPNLFIHCCWPVAPAPGSGRFRARPIPNNSRNLLGQEVCSNARPRPLAGRILRLLLS